jgi:N-acetylglucosaminyldiphosphoundecaprenol N-acetyl-beta-D-mannosaminyltransferase
MDPAIANQIREAQPDILLVAFGNPKQEKWIGMFRRQLSVPVMIGVGGSLDFIAGERKRAPLWMQKLGLEWLFRLLQEPGRLWKRYVVDLFIFSAFFLRQWWAMRRGGDPWTARHSAMIDLQSENITVLRVEGSLTIANYEQFYRSAQEALAAKPYLLLDLLGADFMDSSAIGMLVHMARQARDRSGDLILACVPRNILETLSMLRLDSFFIIHQDVESGLAAFSHNGRNGAGYNQLRYMAYSEQLRGTTWMVVRCPRYFDQDTSSEIQSTCLSLLDDNPFLMLDFSDTVFLTSAGLAVINSLYHKAQQQNGELRVANYSSEVEQVLEMVGFDKFLVMHRNLSFAAI